MAKTTFANGTVVTAAFLNAINNPVFVDTPDDDGEIAKITNANLSTASGQLLPEWQTFRDMLLVTQATSTSISYTAGVVTLPDGTQQVVNAGTIGSLTGTATYFIFVNSSGTVTSSTTYPVMATLMASVVVSGSVISTITDLRPRFEVKPEQENIRLFGGNGGQGVGPSTTQTLSEGLYYYSSWTVPANVTIFIDKFAQIFVSGTVTINGTIAVVGATPNIGGFLSFTDGSGFSGLPGAGLGCTRNSYPFFVQPFGSSGQNGFLRISTSGSGTPGSGGTGGGGLWIEASGTITVATTANISAIGNNGTNGTVSTGTVDASGGGGGSGGTIALYSMSAINIANGATISVRGGNGGNGATTAASSLTCGGAGGGAGQVILTAPVIQNLASSPVINVNGGTAGTLANNGVTGTRTNVNTGGGVGGGNGATGGLGSQNNAGTTDYSLLNATNGANGAIITRQIKAVA